MKTLIKNARVITMNDADQIFDQVDVLVVDDSINKISEKSLDVKADKIINAKNKLILPGFVNAHTHAGMTLLRGYGESLSLEKWLENVIYPIETEMDEKDIYWATRLAICEMIINGITCFSDMYLHFESICQAIIDSGIRGVNAYTLADKQSAVKIDLNNVIKTINKWQKKGEGRLKCVLGPQSINSCSGLLLRQTAQIAKENKIPIHIHLAETKKEVSECKRKYQLSPIELLVKYEFFSQNHVIVAHGIWLSDRDMTILYNNKASIVSNPLSNLKLASGICPTQQLINKGVNVALGTDSAASSNSLDILAEAKLASFLSKYYSSDPSALNAYNALKMATINGAKALGLDNEIGSIEKGKKADLIIVNTNQAHLTPEHNILDNIVYSGKTSDIETVICNGKILMENRQTIFDEDNIIKEFNKRVERLFKDEKESEN